MSPHVFHLSGRPRHRHDYPPVFLHPPARGGALRVGNGFRRGNDRRLADIIYRHFKAAAGEEAGDILFQVFIHAEFFPHQGGDSVPGDIVLRRTQSAGGEYHVRPFPGASQGIRQSVRVIPHRGGKVQVDTQQRQLTGDIGRIGIDYLPQQQFRPD